ncbi:MAG: hypothetical protein HY300_00795 [Verrucomicrobia bacterium]|nr:hypothetical protein [Verrucomicrobiota bacterium]
MPDAPKAIEEKINTITGAWERLRSTKSFAKMTLDEFEAKVKPSLDARKAIKNLETDMVAALDVRDKADVVSTKALQDVVNAVVGDTDEGEDGELYEAMGYVRKSERKSGLTRGAKTPPAQ